MGGGVCVCGCHVISRTPSFHRRQWSFVRYRAFLLAIAREVEVEADEVEEGPLMYIVCVRGCGVCVWIICIVVMGIGVGSWDWSLARRP